MVWTWLRSSGWSSARYWIVSGWASDNQHPWLPERPAISCDLRRVCTASTWNRHMRDPVARISREYLTTECVATTSTSSLSSYSSISRSVLSPSTTTCRPGSCANLPSYNHHVVARFVVATVAIVEDFVFRTERDYRHPRRAEGELRRTCEIATWGSHLVQRASEHKRTTRLIRRVLRGRAGRAERFQERLMQRATPRCYR